MLELSLYTWYIIRLHICGVQVAPAVRRGLVVEVVEVFGVESCLRPTVVSPLNFARE